MLIVNVNIAAKFPSEFDVSQQKVSFVTFQLLRHDHENGGITIETLFPRYYITQKTTNSTSNRIVIMQRKYIFEGETPRTTQLVH